MLLPAGQASAQAIATPERQSYTPLEAGRDAYLLGEARRLGQINRQVDLNARMRWLSWPGSYSGGFFEPWPFIPGDIWGYPLYMTTRQSIGQRNYQAGPTRWISEPVYAEDLAQPVAVSPPLNVGPPTVVAPPAVRLGPSLPFLPNAAAAPILAAPPAFAPPPGFAPAPELAPRPALPRNSSGPREF